MSGERPAFVHYQSWAGHHKEPCIVVDETPKRYRIRVDKPVALPPGFTLLLPGYTKLVPKRAITFTSPTASTEQKG